MRRYSRDTMWLMLWCGGWMIILAAAMVYVLFD
jgi:hypothetical protein